MARGMCSVARHASNDQYLSAGTNLTPVHLRLRPSIYARCDGRECNLLTSSKFRIAGLDHRHRSGILHFVITRL